MVTDNFNGTGSILLTAYSANWLLPVGGISCQINSAGTAATGSDNGAFCANYYNTTVASKHYSKGLIATRNDYHGVAIRVQSAANSFYYAIVSAAGSCFAGEHIAGTPTDWDAGQTGWVDGDTVELHVDAAVDTTILLKRNGTTIATYTGKNALSGGKFGVCTANALNGAGVDSWEGGDVASGAGNPPQSWQQQGAMGVIIAA